MSACVHPALQESATGAPDLQAVRHMPQTRLLDLAIGNELPRSPSNLCLVMQIVIRGTWILPRCHPRTDVASSNASIFFLYHGIRLGGSTFRFLWRPKTYSRRRRTIRRAELNRCKWGFGGLKSREKKHFNLTSLKVHNVCSPFHYTPLQSREVK
jgi:hypothetical protein